MVSVELSSPDGAALPPWRPGAHVELVLPTGIVRQYSLCGSPQDRGCYRIGVLRERASRGGSEYVHAFLRPGQPVRVRGPLDDFGFTQEKAYLFIAGGIGITPILPMVGQAAAWGTPWQLLYGGRSADSMAFLGELRDHPDNVRLYPEDRAGRIPLHEWLDRARPDTTIYACGPEPLLTAVENEAAHWGPGAVQAASQAGPGGHRGRGGVRTVEPHGDRSGRSEHPERAGGRGPSRDRLLPRGRVRHLQNTGSRRRARPSRRHPHGGRPRRR